MLLDPEVEQESERWSFEQPANSQHRPKWYIELARPEAQKALRGVCQIRAVQAGKAMGQLVVRKEKCTQVEKGWICVLLSTFEGFALWLSFE